MRLASMLPLLLLAGCATVFTGTKQEVPITSSPPGATVVVVSGTAANLALKAKKVSDFKDTLVNGLLGGALPPEAKAVLLSLSTDELITQLVLWVRAQQVPAAVAGGAAQAQQVLALVPLFLREKVGAYLGISAIEATPFSPKLRKGREYALVTWAPEHRARLLEIDTRFNWVVLLNVFTFGLGAIVDVLTGAWLNLTPQEVAFTLDPVAPGTQSVIPNLPPLPPPSSPGS